jgi:hypothetical protein
MPRQKSIITIIRDLVRVEIQKALSGLFGGLGVGKPAQKKIKRRRRRRKGTATATTAAKAKRGRPRGSTRRRRMSAAPQS